MRVITFAVFKWRSKNNDCYYNVIKTERRNKNDWVGFYKYILVLNDYCSRCQESNGKLQLMCSSNECLIDPYLLDTLRHQANRLGWSAGNYSEYWGRRYDEGLRLRLGVLHSKKKVCHTSKTFLLMIFITEDSTSQGIWCFCLVEIILILQLNNVNYI